MSESTVLKTKGMDPKQASNDAAKRQPLLTPATMEKLEYLYALMDSANLSYSTVKCLFEILFPDAVSKDMHDLMLSDSGIATMVLTFGFLSSLSLIGRINTKDKSASIKQFLDFLNNYSKYVREGIQTLKYAYKAQRIIFKFVRYYVDPEIAKLLTSSVFQFAIIGLAAISLITRFTLRYIRDERKKHLDYNQNTLKSMLNSDPTIEMDWTALIREESALSRILAILCIIVNTIIDAIYSYLGLITLISLSSFSPPLLIFFVVLCSLYSVYLLFSRIAEDIQLQHELILSNINIRQTALVREYQDLEDRQSMEKLNLAQLQRKQELMVEYYRFDQLKLDMDAGGDLGALLKGIKKGLALYAIAGTLAGSIASIMSNTSTDMPFPLVIFFIVVGLACLIASVATYMIGHMLERHRMLSSQLPMEDGKKSPSLPLTEGPGILDALRSICSAINKAMKIISTIFTGLQKMEDGEYRDEPWLYGISVPYALATGATYGITSHHKNTKNREMSIASHRLFKEKVPSLPTTPTHHMHSEEEHPIDDTVEGLASDHCTSSFDNTP